MWVADRGFASAANRAYLTGGGGHYIHAEKLRHTNTEAAAAPARPGRYHNVADNLRVNEVRVAPGGGTDQGARAERFVVCHNPETAIRDAAVRDRLIEHLQHLIDGSDTWSARRRDELVGTLKTKPGLRRYLRRTKTGLLRVDRAAAHRDGKWLLRTSHQTLTPDDLADAYKQLNAVERGWRMARLRVNGLITASQARIATGSPATGCGSRSSTPNRTTGCCVPFLPPASHPPRHYYEKPCAPSTLTSQNASTPPDCRSMQPENSRQVSMT